MHIDDEKWVSCQLSKLNNPKEILKKYNAVFKEAYMNEPCEIKKMNKARKEANSRLRNYVNKKGA